MQQVLFPFSTFLKLSNGKANANTLGFSAVAGAVAGAAKTRLKSALGAPAPDFFLEVICRLETCRYMLCRFLETYTTCLIISGLK